ncbi:uncharacterized protein LOC123525061 [Mercenaria mercenaria]|uniref:uncharacterized protein LOC123525061 n=1 Tax=Mercenaria mercenaria TaxID=6596 RepID=UPI00234E58E1|nr:uncharacterized protein LOC123525061 [Mercenaria mercenaria]XP_045159701.2 uncharacterized protein LOC123525061 [Mercenaria mercenaria]XP_045159702.2 uncharacterized protein LOC123525061 [Mercenaria mercenaria]XP_045159703.2 uncharacterized protein LOC123525061 [Mercenaria mercenaria]XP_045159704.2 uncharacterized protein LOC123525061 [Mercenaria mercenaria]
MKQLIFQTGCQPFYGGGDAAAINSTGSSSLLAKVLQGCAQNDSTIPVYIDIIETEQGTNEEADSGAVMYIVAVLVFYSAGIVTMIIKYLRREKRELEEERILEDFFRSMPAYKKEREQNNVNRVAIHAFHALTSFSYDDGDDDIVSTDEEDVRVNRAETIHEVENEHYTCNSNVSFTNELKEDGSPKDPPIGTNTEAYNTFCKQSGNSFEEQETIL